MSSIHTSFLALLASALMPFSSVLAEESGKPLPTLSWRDEAGVDHWVEAKGTKLTILHFWATWCVPCVKELPEVDRVAEEYGAKGVKVIAVSMDGRDVDKVKRFYGEHKITRLEVALDPKMEMFQALKINGLPTTIFITPDGKEAARTEGPLDWWSEKLVGFMEEKVK